MKQVSIANSYFTIYSNNLHLVQSHDIVIMIIEVVLFFPVQWYLTKVVTETRHAH